MTSLRVLSVLLELYCNLPPESLSLFLKFVLSLRTRVINQGYFTGISVTFKAPFLLSMYLIILRDLQSAQTKCNHVWEEKLRSFLFLFNLQCLLFVTPNL